MDIKARIDALTEQEANAALKWCVEKIAKNDSKYLTTSIELDVMAKIVLADALREARK